MLIVSTLRVSMGSADLANGAERPKSWIYVNDSLHDVWIAFTEGNGGIPTRCVGCDAILRIWRHAAAEF